MLDVAGLGSVATAEPRRVSFRNLILKSTEGMIGSALGFAMIVLIIVGPYLSTKTALGANTPALGPSMAHPFGTDALGRDVLSRVLSGGRTVLWIPLAAVSLGAFIGGSLGLAAAYVGRWPDNLLTKLFDLMLSIPPLLVVLVVIAGFGSSNVVIIVTVAVAFAPAYGRVVRAATQSVVVNLYVAAAKARGEHGIAIVYREILPNVVAPALAEFGLEVTYGILFVAGLSFLGLGIQPPRADWGLMVSENRGILPVAPLASLAPALAIVLLAVSFNLLTDAFTKSLSGESLAG